MHSYEPPGAATVRVSKSSDNSAKRKTHQNYKHNLPRVAQVCSNIHWAQGTLVYKMILLKVAKFTELKVA
jgi:hypothetical protein